MDEDSAATAVRPGSRTFCRWLLLREIVWPQLTCVLSSTVVDFDSRHSAIDCVAENATPSPPRKTETGNSNTYNQPRTAPLIRATRWPHTRRRRPLNLSARKQDPVFQLTAQAVCSSRQMREGPAGIPAPSG